MNTLQDDTSRGLWPSAARESNHPALARKATGKEQYALSPRDELEMIARLADPKASSYGANAPHEIKRWYPRLRRLRGALHP